MAAPMTVTLFTPHAIFSKWSHDSYVLGYWHVAKNNILVNCTTTIERRNQDFDTTLWRLLNYSLSVPEKENISLLGLMYSSETEKHCKKDFSSSFLNDVTFILRINEASRSFYVEYISITQYPNIIDIQVVIYDGYSIANSQLLPLHKNFSNDDKKEKTFVSFLIGTCQNFTKNSNKFLSQKELKRLKISNFTRLQNKKSLGIKFLSTILWIISIFHCVTSYFFHW